MTHILGSKACKLRIDLTNAQKKIEKLSHSEVIGISEGAVILGTSVSHRRQRVKKRSDFKQNLYETWCNPVFHVSFPTKLRKSVEN